MIFKEGKPWIINLNDCEIVPKECSYIRTRFGKFPILFNQFSIAGFEGLNSYPAPQGQYYCSVGAGNAYGREFLQECLDKAIRCGIRVTGSNMEVVFCNSCILSSPSTDC